MTTTKQYFKVKNGLEFPRQDALTVTDNGGPSSPPSLLLDFANSKELDPRVTFSRASTATYYDGKTLTKAEENLISNSADPTTYFTSIQGLTKTTGYSAPDGSTNAILLTETATNDNHRFYASPPEALANLTYTFSIHVKNASGSRYVGLEFRFSSVNTVKYTFDIIQGYVVANSSITSTTSAAVYPVGNGWFRLSITGVSSASGPIVIGLEDIATNQTPYTGATSNSVYFWGAQFEQRSGVTAYTPTGSQPITNYVQTLKTAAINVPRLDFDPVTEEARGLLIEESKTNVVTQGNKLTQWTKIGTFTIEENAIVAPDGTQSGVKIIGNGSSGIMLYNYYTAAYPAADLTMSIYAKAGSYGFIHIGPWIPNANHAGATFDLVNGTFVKTASVASASMTPVGNGWYRCSVTGGTNYYSSYFGLIVTSYSGTADTVWGIAGNYPTTGQYVYVWGPQTELLSPVMSTYIPTTFTYKGRSTPATYLSTDGIIKTATLNEVRYEPNGSGGKNLLLETQAVNLLNYTNSNFTQVWSISGSGVLLSTDHRTAPDGSLLCGKINYASGAGVSSFIVRSWTSTINTTYTASFYALGTAGETITPYIDSNTGTYVYADAGTVTLTGRWQRISITITTGSNNTGLNLVLRNGTTGTKTLWFWGAQVETGSVASSLVQSVDTWTGRASVASYYDAYGNVRYAPAGAPRYTYNPNLLTAPPVLMLEPQVTNLVTQSSMQSGWGVPNVGYTYSTAVTAPDGTTINSINKNTTYQVLRLGSLFTPASLTYPITYTLSFWAKTVSGSSTFLNYDIGDSNIAVANFTISSTWKRYSHTFTATSSADFPSGGFLDFTIPDNNTYAIWGVQLETGSVATSYIPTIGAAVTKAADTSSSTSQTREADSYSFSAGTRAAENAEINEGRFTPWFRSEEGTLYSESIANHNGANWPVPVSIVNASSSNSGFMQHVYYASGGTNAEFEVSWNGTQQIGAWPGTTAIATRAAYTKILGSYKVNNLISAANGVAWSKTSGVVPAYLSAMWIGRGYGGWYFNGAIKKIAFYPKQLTATEAQSITS